MDIHPEAELKSLLQQAQQSDQSREIIGALALLLGKVVRRRDHELFRQMLHEIGINLQTTDARWMFKVVSQDLSTDDLGWMNSEIGRILSGQEA